MAEQEKPQTEPPQEPQEGLPRVRARVIIEMLGSPKEHLQKTLKKYVEKLYDEPTIEIIDEDYAEPAESENNLWTVFVELEAWFKDANHLIAFCFDAMPGSVEILEPDEMVIPSKEFEGLVNDLQARLHTVDMALKNLKATAKVVDNNAVKIFRNFITYALKQEPKTRKELSTALGLPEEKLKPFLDKLVEEEKIIKKEEKYVLA